MKKLGIIIQKPDRDQKFYTLASEINKMVGPDIDIIVFYLEMGRVMIPTKFSMMEVTQAIQYDGVLISTDAFTTEILQKNQNAKEKYFMVWDLDWTQSQASFESNNKIYNSDIKLLCRSNYHHNVISRTWKKPHKIIGDFNHEQLINL